MTILISKSTIFGRCGIVYVKTSIPKGIDMGVSLDKEVNIDSYNKRHIVLSGCLKNIAEYSLNDSEILYGEDINNSKTVYVFPPDDLSFTRTHTIGMSDDPAVVLCLSPTNQSLSIKHENIDLNKSENYTLNKGNVYFMGIPYILNGKIMEKNTIVGCEKADGVIVPMDDGQIVRFFTVNSKKTEFTYNEETGMMS